MNHVKTLLAGAVSAFILLSTTDACAWGLEQCAIKDPGLPRVLLIGDSILGGYRSVVARQLEGKANVDAYCNPYSQANNEWHDELKVILKGNSYDVIHFNMGLHGYQKGRIPVGQFETLMRRCVETLRRNAPLAAIIWASTTPVTMKDKPKELDPENNPVVIGHNAMAAKLMQECKIPVNDLYGLVAPKTELMLGDTVHWTGPGYELMGQAVAKSVLAHLPRHPVTYIVDNRNPAADDSNPGTEEKPFKTISAAAKAVLPGDAVLVSPGTYRESVRIETSGTEGRPIMFKSKEPLKAVVSGADVMENPTDEGMGVWSYAIPAPYLRDCQYTGGDPQWVYMDGQPLERANTRDRLVPGSFHLDLKGLRAFVSPPEDTDISKVLLEYSHRHGLFSPFSANNQNTADTIDDIHIIGFTLQHNANWFRGLGPIRVSGQRWLVEGNHIRWTSYGGLETAHSAGCIVRDNLIEWAGCQGIGGGPNVNLLIEGNTIRNNNWRSFDWGNEGGGSKWSSTFDSCFRGNTVCYNFGPGLWCDGANCNNVYEKNICHDNTVRAIFSEINWDEVIQDNIVYNTGEAGIIISNGPGMLIRRNIVFNNGIGIGLGGNHTRPNDHAQGWYPSAVARMNALRGADKHRVALWEAGFFKYYVAPKACLMNNGVIWDNILFGNCRTMMEGRDYRTPSPIDGFVNNLSDHNIYWAASEKSVFNVVYSYQYDGLDAWRKASGRDEHSVFADPRDPKTRLPAWAEACRKDWDTKMRSITEVDGIRDDGVRQELYRSPMAQIAIGRMLRSPYLTAVKFEDKRIRGAWFEVEGQRTLAAWTTSPAERRYLRLNLGQPSVTVENGYLGKKNVELAGGYADLLVTYNPVYLRGTGEKFVESQSGIIKVPPFNIAEKPIPVTVSFVNEGAAPASLKAVFSPTAGFAVEPPSAEKELAPGVTHEISLTLKPDGSFRRGTGMLRMDASLGNEKIRRTAVFSVGEGDKKIPRLAGEVRIDGQLDDWGATVKDAIPLATINDAGQYLSGPKDAWKGTDDSSARLYAAWKADALYLAVVVKDDKVIACAGSKNEWGTVQLDKCDAVGISLDGRAPDMQWQKDLNLGCYDATVSPAAEGKHVLSPNWRTNAVQGVSAATALSESGYIVEIAIPLTEKNFPAKQWSEDRPVKLSVLLFDSDDLSPDAKRKVLGWCTSPNQKNSEDTSGWATVILAGER
ncbi:MAG: hypothetical protein A3K19_16620 [Lentisphaerae bacterium RIFOXYB12_FULL_65_16]|nr:MAG: hypothetical protein A3K18_20380 [Lentisphaerae bacterium RIFOXYA12_64_32]OGV89066.1 MAG: hypothetical protein A3K19_16620 [Lentisphaerae bacterium RIFOXYB12_FULL_65_16]